MSSLSLRTKTVKVQHARHFATLLLLRQWLFLAMGTVRA
jgi:hypothetical protein